MNPPSAAGHLRLVDTETGEVQETDVCPHCHEREDALRALEGKYRAALASITQLKRDAEAEARADKRWDELQLAHEWWAIACGHPGVSFDAEAFKQALPRLKERDGLYGLLKAIAGAAFDAGSKTQRNGRLTYFNDWELITRSSSKLRSFQERVPMRAGNDEFWKAWLLGRIEANLSCP